MVRERVKNRNFTNQYIVAPSPDESPIPLGLLHPEPRPLEVDIGCGRGRFLLARAQGHPDINFLGIDQSLLRLRKIDRKAVAGGINNICLIQDDALRLLPRLPALSVATFYVFFPDPWPKRRHHSRRLVSPLFIDLIFQSLAPGGMIHLCTDHSDYFSAMSLLWGADRRFQPVEPYIPTDGEETDFELIFRAQNRHANRCSYRKEPFQES